MSQHYTATRYITLNTLGIDGGTATAQDIDDAVADALQELQERWQRPVILSQVIITPLVWTAMIFVTVVGHPVPDLSKAP